MNSYDLYHMIYFFTSFLLQVFCMFIFSIPYIYMISAPTRTSKDRIKKNAYLYRTFLWLLFCFGTHHNHCYVCDSFTWRVFQDCRLFIVHNGPAISTTKTSTKASSFISRSWKQQRIRGITCFIFRGQNVSC